MTVGSVLPSKQELNQVCRWKSGQTTGIDHVGDTCPGDSGSEVVWSSSQVEDTGAAIWRFQNGIEDEYLEASWLSVWPVRIF